MSNWRKINFSSESFKEPQSSLEFSFDRYVSVENKLRLVGSRYKCLRHSEQIKKIEEFISINAKHGFNLDKMKFPLKEDAFYNQLKIFCLKLKVFSNLRGHETIYSEGELLLGCLRGGFEFNSSYKKKIEEKTRSFLRGETNLVYQDFPEYHLMPWLDEQPIQNMYVFNDPIPINEKKLRSVENVMSQHIADDAFIRDIDLIDAMYLINQKKMNHLDNKGRTKTSFECRGTQLDIEFPTDGLDYLFKKVTTDPATSRAAGLPTVRTRNLVYSAHSNLDLVTINRRDLYREGIEPSTWQQKLSMGVDKYFLMIDLKKSGLTTNRRVIRSVYKTALEHYPGFRPWVSYLENLEQIRVNGMLSKRGTSLGMDDNALSFFLSCAFENWLDYHEKYKKICDGFFKGDDQIIICECEEDIAKEIFRKWIKELRSLGLLVNAKKTFIGKRGQFCEIVGSGSGIDEKIIGRSLNCLDALGCYNYVDFKIYLNNLKKYQDSFRYARIFNYCMTTAILAIPREFCDDELTVPFEMGGYFSNYSKGLNTFIVDCSAGKFDMADRRLFNLIGHDRPEQEWHYRRKQEIFSSIFDDTNNLLLKLRRFSAEPMSELWRKSYDECQEIRQTLFRGPILLKGSRLQKLVDFNDKFALPLDLLIWCPREERSAVPKTKKARGKMRYNLREKWQIKKDMVLKLERKYYLIDEIRAKELLYSAIDSNKFLIKYYTKVPASTLIWSLARTVTESKWAIPKNWLDYCYKTRVSLDNLWSYYQSQGINLYDYKPRIQLETGISALFRGPADADSVMFETWNGFPLAFNSYNFWIWLEVKGRNWMGSRAFFNDLTDYYFQEWLDEPHQIAWFGVNGRNKPFKKEWISTDYSDSNNPTVFLVPLVTTSNIPTPTIENIEEEEETHVFSDSEDEDKKPKGSGSDSDDYLNEYFKDNPLDADTDNEENPYVDISESDSDVG